MMNDCERSDALVGRWESGERPAAAEVDALRAHIATCPRCLRRNGSFLPFLAREASEAPARGPSERARAIADRTMDEILGEEKSIYPIRRPRDGRHLSSPRPSARKAIAWSALGIAAAAALALALLLPRGAPGASDRILVRFVIAEPKATSVSLAGDFTGWKTQGYAMHPDPSGKVWEIEIPLEKGKVYLYNFVVDGTTWTVDPAAIEKVDDGFGGTSALLRL